MKKRASRLVSMLLALCMALALLPGTALAADGPERTGNRQAGLYSNANWASTVTSYLYENEDGGLTRVEYIITRGITVENYDSSFRFLSGQMLPTELSSWGGFFAGENYNFFVFGQSNKEEDDSKEVIRVVKYSKDWQRLGQASLYGANTVSPFRAGSLRFAEYDGMLYIRTCHEMYKSSDGLNHQANMTIAVRESDMTVTDSAHQVSNYGSNYVSHSFNQFILADQEQRLVALDHGDGYPRAILLSVFPAKAGEERISGGKAKEAFIQFFPGKIGANVTCASVGGMAETTGGYVVAYDYMYDKNEERAKTHGIYFSYVDKDSLRVETKEVCAPGSYPGASTPVLAPTGLDGGYILWNEYGPIEDNGDDSWNTYIDTMCYAAYSADGSVGEIKKATAALSDCQPIVYNGKVVWYTTNYKDVITFYQLDDSGVTTVQVPKSGTPISTPVSVIVRGESVAWSDAVPFIDSNGRTLVPLRAIADALVVDVDWNGNTREAIFTDGLKTITFPIGSSTARTSDGQSITMDTAAIIRDGRTYAPVRALAEYFGYRVGWDAARRTVVIKLGPPVKWGEW